MKRKLWVIVLLIFLIAVTSNVIWLYEIVVIKSWEGLNWLSGYMYSPYIITLLISIAAVLPFYYYRNFTFARTCFFTAFIWVSNFISFIFFEIFLKSTLNRMSIFIFGSKADLFNVILIGALAVLLSSFTLSILFRELNKKYAIISFLYALINPVIILVLSQILVIVYVWRGSVYWQDYYHNVKMGYPTFWLAITYGGLSIFFNYKAIKNAQ